MKKNLKKLKVGDRVIERLLTKKEFEKLYITTIVPKYSYSAYKNNFKTKQTVLPIHIVNIWINFDGYLVVNTDLHTGWVFAEQVEKVNSLSSKIKTLKELLC
jgi:Na+-transporting NADH:ubiquinone oxidoreductase subunit NqrC